MTPADVGWRWRTLAHVDSTLVTMDQVGFHLQEQQFPTGPLLTVMPYVNRQQLTDLLTYTDRPGTRRQVGLGLGDGHAGLAAEQVRWPSRHFLGAPVEHTFGGDTALLGCSCGIYSCGPFSAVVTLEAGVVVWSHFRFAEEDTYFTELRDLVFDRELYEAALWATAEPAGAYRTCGRRR